MDERIHLIIKTHPDLFDSSGKLPDIKRIEQATSQIPCLYQPAKSYLKWQGGKHTLERHAKHLMERNESMFERGGYIRNDDFVVAMIICGYEYKQRNGRTVFKASKRPIYIERCV
jgi:hypothetical protein